MDDAKQKVTDLLKKARTGMLTTMTPDGAYHSRPMALQDVEFVSEAPGGFGDLWFFTYESTDKVRDIKANPAVNVAIDEGHNTWLSVAGGAEIVQDRAKAEELWNPLLKAWFKDGLDTPGITLIKVHADSAEYWDAPNSAVVNLFGMAKAAVTGEQAKGGKNESVAL